MKIAVIISTFRRGDGKTPELLKQTLSSVFNQTFKDFKLFLIGDNYENEEEFKEITNYFEFNDRLHAENQETQA
jgi:glycosyltransferase involved in cell wall biosynthesis